MCDMALCDRRAVIFSKWSKEVEKEVYCWCLICFSRYAYYEGEECVFWEFKL
jgi:hypothetical protein